MTQVLGAQAWYVCHSIEGRLHTGPLSFRAGEGTVGIRSCTQIKNFILKSLTMYMYTGKFIRCVHVSVNTFCVHISLSERLLFFCSLTFHQIVCQYKHTDYNSGYI